MNNKNLSRDIDDAISTLGSATQEIEELEAENETLKSRIEELEAEITEKDNIISELKDKNWYLNH